jgi:hypothetical protein
MSQFNFPGNSTSTALLIAASCANTAAATSPAGFDLQDYEGPVVIVQNHGVSTGTLDGKIQDSADNASFADVAGLTFAQSTTTADIKTLVVQSKQVRRYIKYVGTVVTGPQVAGVTLTGCKKSV